MRQVIPVNPGPATWISFWCLVLAGPWEFDAVAERVNRQSGHCAPFLGHFAPLWGCPAMATEHCPSVATTALSRNGSETG